SRLRSALLRTTEQRSWCATPCGAPRPPAPSVYLWGREHMPQNAVLVRYAGAGAGPVSQAQRHCRHRRELATPPLGSSRAASPTGAAPPAFSGAGARAAVAGVRQPLAPTIPLGASGCRAARLLARQHGDGLQLQVHVVVAAHVDGHLL